jgi:DNA uptake protein ComE-like DNA-binding protein
MKRKMIALLLAFPMLAHAKPSTTPTQAKADVVNVNKASAEQLAYLPGVGTKTAERMIAARPLKCSSLDEQVSGIGAKKQAAIEPHCADGDEPTTLAHKLHKGE